jgi:hypothetical protein
LLVLYLLTFNGRFTSIDELAIYARAESRKPYPAG